MEQKKKVPKKLIDIVRRVYPHISTDDAKALVQLVGTSVESVLKRRLKMRKLSSAR